MFFGCVFLGSVRYTLMGNAAGSVEVPQGKEGKTASASPGSQKQTKGLKLPMPPEEELEQRFSAVLVSCAAGEDTCQVSHRRKELMANGRKKLRNVEYVGNVHVLRTSLSQCQVHNATVERCIRAPLCWSLMQH